MTTNPETTAERWEAWKADLEQAAAEYGMVDINPDDYRGGFELGYSPECVLQEDEENADDV